MYKWEYIKKRNSPIWLWLKPFNSFKKNQWAVDWSDRIRFISPTVLIETPDPSFHSHITPFGNYSPLVSTLLSRNHLYPIDLYPLLSKLSACGGEKLFEGLYSAKPIRLAWSLAIPLTLDTHLFIYILNICAAYLIRKILVLKNNSSITMSILMMSSKIFVHQRRFLT